MQPNKLEVFHKPVLLKETIDFLDVKPGEVYIDCTIGGGGHALQIIKKGGCVFGLDCDWEAVDFAKKYLQSVCPGTFFKIIYGNFANLENLIKENKIANPAGIIFDLGTSLHQLKTKGRGFSFLKDEPLDMRMDNNLSVKAIDLINGLTKKELNELFSRLGEEKLSLAIANAVVFARRLRPIKTTGQLAKICFSVYRKKYKTRSKIHPATKVFQALRIAVNDELNNLKQALPQALKILKNKGRLVVISFHGLENKIVKDFFKQQSNSNLKILTKKPIVPTQEEIRKNPASRSAKLQAVEKI